MARQLEGCRLSSRTTTPADLRPAGLHVVGVHAVVADHRRRHHDDLAEVARVGERLLIAGEIGGEDHFTEGGVDRSRSGAGNQAPSSSKTKAGRSVIRSPRRRSTSFSVVGSGHRRWAPACLAAARCWRRCREGAVAAAVVAPRGCRPAAAERSGPARGVAPGAAAAARRGAAARHQRENSDSTRKIPPHHQVALVSKGDRLAAAKDRIGRASAERSEPAALAGLKQHDHRRSRASRISSVSRNANMYWSPRRPESLASDTSWVNSAGSSGPLGGPGRQHLADEPADRAGHRRTRRSRSPEFQSRAHRPAGARPGFRRRRRHHLLPLRDPPPNPASAARPPERRASRPATPEIPIPPAANILGDGRTVVTHDDHEQLQSGADQRRRHE